MVEPAIEGIRLYKLLFNDYDDNFGGSVVGISGTQGSVKTAVCLDLVEKKIQYHPEELLFWRETLKSPMQCQRLLDNDYKIYIEKNLKLRFIESKTQKKIKLPTTSFNNVNELYKIVSPGVLNVIFFNTKKNWTSLINTCNMHSNEWTTIFLDEMEGLYYAGANNQTKDRWWDWMQNSGEIIKECRKGHTSIIGNYHDENIIDHRVKGKFMFYLYGFGAVVNPSRSRITQSFVDGCKIGEFCIAQGRNRFGKVQIKNFYPAIKNCIIPY